MKTTLNIALLLFLNDSRGTQIQFPISKGIRIFSLALLFLGVIGIFSPNLWALSLSLVFIEGAMVVPAFMIAVNARIEIKRNKTDEFFLTKLRKISLISTIASILLYVLILFEIAWIWLNH